jgi:6-pyruvoyl-tetrahydropterin synthase
VDIVDVEKHLDDVVGYYKEQMLNEKPEFAGLNPSIEHFARILATTLNEKLKQKISPRLKVVLWEHENAWAAYRVERLKVSRFGRRSNVPTSAFKQLMKIGFVIYGSLDTLSGGYMYDRRLVEYLRAQGDTVEIISLPWRNYAAHLIDNSHFKLPANLDILIQDELNHPSLITANRRPHPYPIISLVHHLRCSELRPKWQNAFYRVIEKKYLYSVDGFIFNSQTTKNVVNGLMDHGKPSVVAYPPTDRFGRQFQESEIERKSKSKELRILFLGNVIERKGLNTLLKPSEC